MEIHYCEHCEEHEAEVAMTAPGGEVHYLCTSPECMMSAGMCPSCQVDLEVTITDTGESLYHCPHCSFEQTYKELGQP
jgi:hypothetical protein